MMEMEWKKRNLLKNGTFDLIDKIKEVKGITDLGDGEINEVLKEDEIQTTLSD